MTHPAPTPEATALLSRAADELTRRGWCRYYLEHYLTGEVCLLGALDKAATDTTGVSLVRERPEYQEAARRLAQVLVEQYPKREDEVRRLTPYDPWGGCLIATYNNQVLPDAAAAVAALEKAAAA